MTTYGYARVSRKGQDTQAQVEQLRKAGAEEIRTEQGSGKNEDRPIWKQLVEELSEGDTLVVYDLDRISRHAAYLMAFQEEVLEARGVTLIYDNRRHNPSNRGDRMSYGVKAIFAEDERLAISERTTRTITYKRSQGERMGRREVLTPRQKVAIRQKHKEGRSISELARTYSCSRTTVRSVVTEAMK